MGLPAPRDGWILGVDTSRAQGLLDVGALDRAGVSFAIFKATDGLSGVDPQWSASAAAARDLGLPFGAYGVLEPHTDPRAQALHFVDQVRGSGACFYALDFELAAGETALAALEAAVTWCEVVEEALGCSVLVYASPSFLEQLLELAGVGGARVLAQLAKGRRAWVAHYGVTAPRVPPGWSDWTIWQASGDHGATLPGTTIAVDVDWFRGTLEELLAIGSGGS